MINQIRKFGVAGFDEHVFRRWGEFGDGAEITREIGEAIPGSLENPEQRVGIILHGAGAAELHSLVCGIEAAIFVKGQASGVANAVGDNFRCRHPSGLME